MAGFDFGAGIGELLYAHILGTYTIFLSHALFDTLDGFRVNRLSRLNKFIFNEYVFLINLLDGSRVCLNL